MKHISQIIAEMSDDWKLNAGVKTPTVDGAALIRTMDAAGELAFLDAVKEPPKKGKARTHALSVSA
jgi:uncharacterized protein YggU (UPF0235/DUF167 family)